MANQVIKSAMKKWTGWLRAKLIGADHAVSDEEPNNLRETLWNKEEAPEELNPEYSDVLLEQYKLYVELADRISQRRGSANNFFLTINTGTVAGLVGLNSLRNEFSSNLTIYFLLGLIIVCIIWQVMISAYRELSSVKWKVVNFLEERLPASPWKAEWLALSEGGDHTRYRGLTSIERSVPKFLALLYFLVSLLMCFFLS